jgi:hypothetical protein
MKFPVLFYEESEERADLLIRWCSHLKALSDIMGSLAFDKEGEGSAVLERRGVELGEIMLDLSRNIHDVLVEAYPELKPILAQVEAPEQVINVSKIACSG